MLIGPIANQAILRLRDAAADWTVAGWALPSMVQQTAHEIFNILGPFELGKHPGDIVAFQRAVGIDDCGVGEVALRYAHYIYRKAVGKPLTLDSHQKISESLDGLAITLEAKWWQTQPDPHARVPQELPPASVTGRNPDPGNPEPSSLRVKTETSSRVCNFIESVAAETGTRIKKKMIWSMAGYRSRTDFERFQREDPEATDTARRNLNRILQMTPSEFIAQATKLKLFSQE